MKVVEENNVALADDESLLADDDDDTTSGSTIEDDEQTTDEVEGEEEHETDDDQDEGEEQPDGKKDETEDETDDDDEDEEDEDAEITDEDDEDDVLTEDEAIKAATTKYPNIFKEFPDLRKFVYLGKQLAAVFPTPEAAEEASEKAELMDGIGYGLAEGRVSVLINALSASDKDGATLELFADRVLPALHKKDPKLFSRATMPVLANAARLLHKVGTDQKDKNKIAAAKIFAQSFFPDGNLPTGVSAEEGESAEAKSLKQQLAARDQRDHQNFNAGVRERSLTTARTELLNSLKDKKLNDTQKEMLVDKIIERVERRLAQNPDHMKKMLLIQKQAFKHGHTPAISARLMNEWLTSARPVLRLERARLLPKFLGEKVEGKEKKKVKRPLGSGGTGGKSGKEQVTKDGKATPPDWEAMRKAGISDADYLMGKEIAKK